MNTKEYILNQFKLYPQLELQDLMKFLYQSSFGCEHLVSDFLPSNQVLNENYKIIKILRIQLKN